MTANPAWEQVLALVEADARQAAELVRGEQGAHAAAPADGWSLPSAVLPPLADMPEVPEELRERIEGLRSRIDALRAELADALRDWQQPARALSTVPPASQQPLYMDRRL